MSESEISSELSVSVRRATALLGYASRSTVYERIRRGDLDAVSDAQGRTTVTKASIERYLGAPPPGSWSQSRQHPRPPEDPDRARGHVENPTRTQEIGAELTALRVENVRLREVVTRLQIVREKEAAARAAEGEVSEHLSRALERRGHAKELTASALSEMDELLTLLITPDTAQDAE